MVNRVTGCELRVPSYWMLVTGCWIMPDVHLLDGQGQSYNITTIMS